MQSICSSNYFPYYGYGNGYGLTPPYTIFDQCSFGGHYIQPRQIIYNVYDQRKPSYESKKLSKRGGRYYMTERNSREVVIGEMDISNPLVVNPRDNGSFDCIYCEVKGEGMPEKRACQFPMEAIRKHNPLPYIPDFRRNPDCPPGYIIAAFFEELFSNNELKFLNLPPHSGWNLLEGRLAFVSAESVIPQLKEYYAPDIPLRQMPQTDRTLQQAVDELAVLLPDNNACRILFNANVSGILLGVYEAQQLKPDRMFVVPVESERNAKLATVLLQNRKFTDTYTCSLLESKSVLQGELASTWDGTAIFRDSSFVESQKRRNAGIDVLLEHLHRGQGINEVNRKIIAAITDNASVYSSELPAVYVEMSGCPEVEKLDQLQQAIGSFLAALIQTLINSDATENLVTAVIKHTPLPLKTIENGGEVGTETIMRCTATLLSELGLFDRTHMSQLDELFRRGADAVCDQDLAIVNEFRSVLSSMIDSGELGAANQFSPPYYSEPDEMIMLDREHDCVNFSADVLNKLVRRLKSTQRRNIVLHALTTCGKLRANNNYKRLLDVEIAPNVIKTMNFYSVPRTMLTESCGVKLNGVRFADYLIPRSDFQEGFVPIVQGENGFAAGRLINDNTDEAESIYVSGKTRSGKTYLLVQQAVIRAAAGHRVIVFDQTGAFTPRELRKHLPEAIVDKYFSLWDLGEQGLPVNLLSLERCKDLRDKKDRLENVLSVLARLTGEVQSKTLRSRLTKITREIEAGQLHGLSGVLRFFDADDPDQAVIRDRLAEAFEDLEGLPESWMTWGEFLAAQGKIVIISTGSDSIRKSSQFIDALLASLYAWKQYNYDERMTVILDEISDLCLKTKGPIETVMRKGGKSRLALMLATQQYSAEKDLLGEVIGNCGMKVFFRPKDSDLKDVSKKTGIERHQLATLMQGECVATGSFHSKTSGKNITATLKGKTYTAAEYLAPPDQPTETLAVSDALSEAQSDEEFMLSESANLCDLPLTSPAPDEIEPEPEMQPSQSPKSTDDVPEAESSEDVEPPTPESEDEPAESIPVTVELLAPQESEPDEPENNPQVLIEQELQHRFERIMFGLDPDDPYLQSDLNDLLAQILEKHLFVNSDERIHLQCRLQSLIANGIPDCPAFREELRNIYNSIWPDANSNI